jgi:hypothetical protein
MIMFGHGALEEALNPEKRKKKKKKKKEKERKETRKEKRGITTGLEFKA